MDSERLTLTALAAGMLTRWRTVAWMTVGIAALALFLSFILPPGYESEATFVTTDTQVQLPNGLADLTSQPGMAGLVSQLGLGASRDPSTSPAFYAQLLDSRELLTQLVLSRVPDPRKAATDSADLVAIFRIRNKDRERGVEVAIKHLKRAMKVGIDPRTSFVSITLSTPWARLSAAVANRAVELVSAFNSAQRQSRARARRVFLEGRVADAQSELHAAEGALSDFYERNRLWRSSPGLIVQEASLRRQVEMASELYLSIRQQYESARIDEVNTTPVITVVDTAVPSHQPLWTRRLAVALTAGLLGAWLGLLWVAGRVLAGHWAGRHPADAEVLRQSVRHMWREVGGTLRRRRA
ncbi:MAG: GNVR domain-containing protein [Gemmatimonadales bacterium]|jgi:uncharacterized protein involved in exopolysaccharide biosynthesis